MSEKRKRRIGGTMVANPEPAVGDWLRRQEPTTCPLVEVLAVEPTHVTVIGIASFAWVRGELVVTHGRRSVIRRATIADPYNYLPEAKPVREDAVIDAEDEEDDDGDARGRPPRDPAGAATHIVTLRLTAAEHATLRRLVSEADAKATPFGGHATVASLFRSWLGKAAAESQAPVAPKVNGAAQVGLLFDGLRGQS